MAILNQFQSRQPGSHQIAILCQCQMVITRLISNGNNYNKRIYLKWYSNNQAEKQMKILNQCQILKPGLYQMANLNQCQTQTTRPLSSGKFKSMSNTTGLSQIANLNQRQVVLTTRTISNGNPKSTSNNSENNLVFFFPASHKILRGL